jgi:hypothetical protein
MSTTSLVLPPATSTSTAPTRNWSKVAVNVPDTARSALMVTRSGVGPPGT